jgi:hypothetical protein
VLAAPHHAVVAGGEDTFVETDIAIISDRVPFIEGNIRPTIVEVRARLLDRVARRRSEIVDSSASAGPL